MKTNIISLKVPDASENNDINRKIKITNTHNDANTIAKPGLLRSSVATALETYLNQLEDQQVTNLYSIIMNEVESTILEIALQTANGNQTTAAQLLGINRGTLRKKLKNYQVK